MLIAGEVMLSHREDELTRLRVVAERCYRLALAPDRTVTAILRAMGREADEEIASLEARTAGSTPLASRA
jgi:hypothetical protein